MRHFLSYLMNNTWAMPQAEADRFREVVDRMLDGTKVDMEVLEAYRAETVERGERLRARDGVGILYVDGPLFKKSNLFVNFSGATSYEMVHRDLQVALDDRSIHSIVLRVDSPGGEASGCDELANAIYDARGKKPITAFVSGMAASGGYWLASSASRVVVSDAALLGSIGVVLGMRDTSEAEEKRGVKTIQFVSSQSPGKRPDPKTDEGKDRIQTMVNDLADVFISAVARNRGVTAETVIKKFGAGGVEVGKKAVALGMADAVGSFEGVLASLKAGGKGRISTPLFGGFSMSDENTGPSAAELAAKAAADATKAAQVRMKTILTASAAANFSGLAAYLAYETTMSSEDASKILASANTDFEAAMKAKEEETPTPAGSGTDFVAHKNNAGALVGVGRDEPAPQTSGEKSAKLWGDTVGRVNAGFGL